MHVDISDLNNYFSLTAEPPRQLSCPDDSVDFIFGKEEANKEMPAVPKALDPYLEKKLSLICEPRE